MPRPDRTRGPAEPAVTPGDPGRPATPDPRGSPPETPPVPTERARQEADLATLGLAADDRQLDALQRFVTLLQRWNTTYNLTAVRDPAAIWVQHVLDCLAALPALARHRAACGSRLSAPWRLLDVGSGGGLPGVVWALFMPEAEVHCVDAVGKKAAFVRQVAAELPLPNLHAHHARVEALRTPAFDLITCRAFASLSDFTRLSRPLLAPEGVWLALKGKVPQAEIDALPASVHVFHVEQVQVPHLAAERCLVWMRPSPPPALRG